MFREYPCGCIVSTHVGRVRICGNHQPDKASGDGGLLFSAPLKGKSKRYPAFGQMPPEWGGK